MRWREAAAQSEAEARVAALLEEQVKAEEEALAAALARAEAVSQRLESEEDELAPPVAYLTFNL